tara:strand:- start:74 stop:274 length:201 start_codon:yes stop_codon:yes gene_type:complete
MTPSIKANFDARQRELKVLEVGFEAQLQRAQGIARAGIRMELTKVKARSDELEALRSVLGLDQMEG